MQVDTIISEISELIPMNNNGKAISGKEWSQLEVIKNGFIAIKNGKIIACGPADMEANFSVANEEQRISAYGKTVTPGFVDCHTHLVFAGSRENEFLQRIENTRVVKNKMMGGGINYTVSKTREADKNTLKSLAKKRLKRLLINGVTTIESKSGYGLAIDQEIKILQTLSELNKEQKVEIVSTFLGAHSVPEGYNSQEYTDLVSYEMMPLVAKEKLAKFCDVFCENGFFSHDQSLKILTEAQKYGFDLKIHADQLSNTEGAQLAAKVGAVSADHLDHSSEQGLKAMAEVGVIGVLLPTVTMMLELDLPDVKNMFELGVPLAISTDFNPGAGYSEAMSLVVSLACSQMKMLPLEALAAATINAAYAAGVGNKVGSLEIGKQADILIFDAPNHNYIPYHYGVNLVETVIKAGKVVHSVN